MKKWTLFLSLYFCIALILGGCGMEGNTVSEPPAAGPADPVSSAELVDQAPWTATCRVITIDDGGELLLAEFGQAATEIYTLTPEEPLEGLRPGQLVNVTFDAVLETWPAQLAGAAVEPREDGFDDRCALYLQVLEDLWNKDAGLNGGVEQIGVDLSQTSLSPGERTAVAWAFAANHGAELLEGTWKELVDQGYISAEPLVISGSGEDLGETEHYFFEWKNGCHYSITEREMEGVYSLTPVTFDAQKWRTSLGAYFFCDCTALQSAMGEWSNYTVGAHAIS